MGSLGMLRWQLSCTSVSKTTVDTCPFFHFSFSHHLVWQYSEGMSQTESSSEKKWHLATVYSSKRSRGSSKRLNLTSEDQASPNYWLKIETKNQKLHSVPAISWSDQLHFSRLREKFLHRPSLTNLARVIPLSLITRIGFLKHKTFSRHREKFVWSYPVSHETRCQGAVGKALLRRFEGEPAPSKLENNKLGSGCDWS